MAFGTPPGEMPEPPQRSAGQRSFGERLWGAIKLDASVYEEVEHDQSAMGQAAGVVAIGAIATGLASLTGVTFGGLVGGIIAGLLGWILSAALIWAIGVKMMECSSDFGELMRTLGFASAPKFLLFFGVIGFLRPLAWIVASVLTVIAFVIAVRQALDVGTGRALFVCLIAVGLSVLLGLFLGGLSVL
jgi:hypothetical protein